MAEGARRLLTACWLADRRTDVMRVAMLMNASALGLSRRGKTKEVKETNS